MSFTRDLDWVFQTVKVYFLSILYVLVPYIISSFVLIHHPAGRLSLWSMDLEELAVLFLRPVVKWTSSQVVSGLVHTKVENHGKQSTVTPMTHLGKVMT